MRDSQSGISVFGVQITIFIHLLLSAGKIASPLSCRHRQGLFSVAKPRLAVFSHVETQRRCRWCDKTTPLPLEVGEDLMLIEVGDKVDFRSFDAAVPNDTHRVPCTESGFSTFFVEFPHAGRARQRGGGGNGG